MRGPGNSRHLPVIELTFVCHAAESRDRYCREYLPFPERPMRPRTVQLIATLGWSLAILSWVQPRESATSPEPIWLDRSPDLPTDPRLRVPVVLALETLRGMDRIFVDAVSPDPNQALYGLAWQTLERHPRADSLFAELFYHGSHPAQLYALAGLQVSGSEHYD